MIDTNAVSGISNASQVPKVTAPSPVASVQPPARSEASGSHDPSLARQQRRAPDEQKTFRSEEKHSADSRTVEDEQPREAYEAPAERELEETELRIDRDSDTGRIIFQTVRSDTGEVIRQVPSEEMVSLAKSIREAQGLLVDRVA